MQRMHRAMNWREAIRAAAATARERQRNAKDSIGRFGEKHSAEARGTAYAYGVIADEFDWIADERNNSREALSTLRGWLRRAEEMFEERKVQIRKRNHEAGIEALKVLEKMRVEASCKRCAGTGYETIGEVCFAEIKNVCSKCGGSGRAEGVAS